MERFEYAQDLADVEELLEQSWEHERQQVQTELQQLDEQLEARKGIHDQTVDELETELDASIERLELLYKRSQGKHGERAQLKSRIESLSEALRVERRTHWRDCQDLLTERREFRRELRALESDLSAALFEAVR